MVAQLYKDDVTVIQGSCHCYTRMMPLSYTEVVTVLQGRCHCYTIMVSLLYKDYVTVIWWRCHCYTSTISLIYLSFPCWNWGCRYFYEYFYLWYLSVCYMFSKIALSSDMMAVVKVEWCVWTSLWWYKHFSL
jgi:hypothetical protein